MRPEFEKKWDEIWERAMSQADGYKIARALYEVCRIVEQEGNPLARRNFTAWDELLPGERELFQKVIEVLFDSGVIESGRAVPELYDETGDFEFIHEGKRI